ncbi:MAG: universal stress protein [Candidatus Sulfotelmatobacter sp.]
MKNVKAGARISLTNILYLTDFSESSEIAFPYACAIAHEYGAKVHAVHVLLPDPYVSMTPELAVEVNEAQEQTANANMREIGTRFGSLAHETVVEKGLAVWSRIERTICDRNIGLIVLGTRGRTGVQKLLLGSVAEEIFRNSKVPVLTIGPSVRKTAPQEIPFHSVLLATDFAPSSLAAVPYAFSLAEENQAYLFLLHVIPHLKKEEMLGQLSVADAMHQLYGLIPRGADLWCRPEPSVEYGVPAEKILAVAHQREADLIVLGIRRTEHRGLATRLGRTTAHHVVSHAAAPVLTVRG